jgi:hypothetical protein
MKSFLLVLVLFLLIVGISIYFMGQSKWHLQRNQINQLPTGKLTLDSGRLYLDDKGLEWERQPHIKNKFHQPDGPVQAVENPYPIVIDTSLKMDINNPNLKFLCKLENGGSYEAILQPNGQYLTEGIKQGTYNYGHPSGFVGILKHTIWDVLPHFVNSKYE